MNKTQKILAVALATFNKGHKELASDIFALAAENPEALEEVAEEKVESEEDLDTEAEEEEEEESDACFPGVQANFIKANRLKNLAIKVATAGHKDLAYRILAEAEELKKEDDEAESCDDLDMESCFGDDDEDVESCDDVDLESCLGEDDEDVDLESCFADDEEDEDLESCCCGDEEFEEEEVLTEPAVAAKVNRLSKKIAKAGYTKLARKLRNCI